MRMTMTTRRLLALLCIRIAVRTLIGRRLRNAVTVLIYMEVLLRPTLREMIDSVAHTRHGRKSSVQRKNNGQENDDKGAHLLTILPHPNENENRQGEPNTPLNSKLPEREFRNAPFLDRFRNPDHPIASCNCR